MAVLSLACASTPELGDASGSAGAGSGSPEPVVIVAGTISPAFVYGPLRRRLHGDGYQAYVYTLPRLGLGDIRKAAEPLVGFVDRILAATGAERIDLVAHSQGGLVARYYVEHLGGAARVDSLVSLAAPHHGTRLANVFLLIGFGRCFWVAACEQMAVGSRFLEELNLDDETVGELAYTNLYTATDSLVWPVRTATLGDGAQNVKLQSQCRFRPTGHLGLIFDGAVYDGIRDALRHEQVVLGCGCRASE